MVKSQIWSTKKYNWQKKSKIGRQKKSLLYSGQPTEFWYNLKADSYIFLSMSNWTNSKIGEKFQVFLNSLDKHCIVVEKNDFDQ